MRDLDTKEKILSSARALFVEHGYSGTSIGKIAKHAGINHSLIYHHFVNKDNLWLKVKHHIVTEANEHQLDLPCVNQPLEAFLRELFVQNLQFYRNSKDIIRMLNWQRLESDGKAKIGLTNSTHMQAWVQAFKTYQLRGDIDRQLKPEFIVTMILSIISTAALDPNVFINGQHNFDRYVDFSIKGILKFLA
jgi:AcrR family transcriptional regulator